MGRIFIQLKEQWEQIRGDAKWAFLSWMWRRGSEHIWIWGPAMAITIVTTIWGMVEALPGPALFVIGLGAFAIGLLFANEVQLRRIRTKWEQRQSDVSVSTVQLEELEGAHRTIAELQAKLAAIEDTQPRLKAEAVIVQRGLHADQQPRRELHWPPSTPRGGRGSFALLRITNDPESKSDRAIAYDLRATIAYSDENGKEFFPFIEGAWGSPDHSNHPGSMGNLSAHVKEFLSPQGFLRPQEFAHLGIALRYPWNNPQECYALSEWSQRFPDWVCSEWQLSGETIHVKVTIVGKGIKDSYYYKIKNCGPKDGLQLEVISPPSFDR